MDERAGAVSVLDELNRGRWLVVPLAGVVERRQEVGFESLEPLSVFLDVGVVRRADRTDNHNALGRDLGKYQRVAPGDLVFNKLRTWQGGFGVSRYEGIVSPAYIICAPKGQVDSRFLGYVLRSRPYLAELTRISKWMPPSQFDILWSDLKRVPVPLPATEEQRRIADFLDERVARIDNVIAARRQQVEGVGERRAAEVRDVTLGLGGSSLATDLPWAAEVGSDREVRRLGHLARMGTGHTPSRSVAEYWTDCTIPWLTTADVHKFRYDQIEVLPSTEFHISELGLANSAAVLHPAGTVALSRTASAGFAVIMGDEMATSQDYVTWTCGPELRPRFLLALLRIMRPYLLGYLSMGSTHKTIYFPDLAAIRIPVPALPIQDLVAAHLDEVDEAARRVQAGLRRSLDLLAEYKQSLITAAVTGELDVTTARKEVPA